MFVIFCKFSVMEPLQDSKNLIHSNKDEISYESLCLTPGILLWRQTTGPDLIPFKEINSHIKH